jgi:hypothetical protein
LKLTQQNCTIGALVLLRTINSAALLFLTISLCCDQESRGLFWSFAYGILIFTASSCSPSGLRSFPAYSHPVRPNQQPYFSLTMNQQTVLSATLNQPAKPTLPLCRIRRDHLYCMRVRHAKQTTTGRTYCMRVRHAKQTKQCNMSALCCRSVWAPDA